MHLTPKLTLNSTLSDFSPHYSKTQPRIVKYKNNRLVNPQNTYNLKQLPEMQKDRRKWNRSPIKLEKLVKPSLFEKAEMVKSAQLSPEGKEEDVEKREREREMFRTVEDDTMSRVSRASKGSKASRGTKYQNKIKIENETDEKNKDKNLSKQLAMKIRNQSIHNWNLTKQRKNSNKNEEKSTISDNDEIRSNFSTRSHRVKTETDAYKNKLEQLKEQENELFEDDQVWNNSNLKAFLRYYGINDKHQLFEFLENNQEYSPSLYNIGHIHNYNKAALSSQPTEYRHKFQGQDKDQSLPLLKQQDYQTLHRLAMMKNTLKTFTTNESTFNVKPLPENQISLKPENWLSIDKKQIVSGTSYEFNYPSRLDYQSKIIEKVKEEHVVVGYPFFGKTQYKNNFIDLPTQSFTATEMAQFFKYKQSDSNPMKLNKGVNFFNSTYKRQFVSKSLNNRDERIRAKSQLECSVERPRNFVMDMYLTSTQNEYTKYEPALKKKHKVDPNKYGALSRLKTILMLNKSLKKEIVPHIPHETSILK